MNTSKNVKETKKLELIVGTFRVDCRNKLDPMTTRMLQMMGVFAELELEMTRQCIISGMANAKAKGSVLGRPVTTIHNLPT